MKRNGKKVHILRNPKLRKIRYNLRALWVMEYQKRLKNFFEERISLRAKKDKGEINFKEWNKRIQRINENELDIAGALSFAPVHCTKCKSVKNDLQQDKEGWWECYGEHERDKRGLSRPTSPFDDDLILWNSRRHSS